MAAADEQKLISASGYYATDSGKSEVERGSHDDALRNNSITREEWLEKWNLKNGSTRIQG